MMIDLIEKENTCKISVTGKKWSELECTPRDVLTIMQRNQLPEIVAKVLANRGIQTENIENYLFPTIKNNLPDPFHLKDMDRCATRLAKAITEQERVAIFGDYDVDGATSSALLSRYFKDIGLDHLIYIPDRIKEGYGPNLAALLSLKQQGAKVIITVDCGTTTTEILESATQNNLDIIVVDHHLGAENLPKICALVNPNRLDDNSEYKYLAAVGVCFLVLVAVNMTLKKLGFPEDKLPNLINLLDLVALGTVCDVVPLRGLNRSFVTQGIKVLGKNNNLGLAILKDIAKIDQQISSYHLGYLLGPRINAGGRVGEADLGVKLLTTSSANEAKIIALKLDQLNNERKVIEANILEEAMKEAHQQHLTNKVLVITGKDWHQGVIGIIASRIKEKFNLPVAVITFKDDIGKASCRSIKGFNFGNTVFQAKLANIITEGGGHEMAAGFSIHLNQIDILRKFLEAQFNSFFDTNLSTDSSFAGIISIEGINNDLCKMIELLGPFGAENPEPKFLLKNVFALKTEIFGAQHLRVVLGNAEIKIGKMLIATIFRAVDSEIGNLLLSRNLGSIDVIGYLRLNTWQNREKVDFIIDDLLVNGQ